MKVAIPGRSSSPQESSVQDKAKKQPEEGLGTLTSLRNHAIVGLAASLFLSLIEWTDLNLQGREIFSSFGDRLTYSAYLSLNLTGGLVLGLLVGIAAILGCRLAAAVEAMLPAVGRKKGWTRLASYIFVGVLGAIVLKQQAHVHGYAVGLIREAEKLPLLNEFLLNHERSTSYLVVAMLVIACSLMRKITLASRSFAPIFRVSWIVALCLVIGVAYYIDSRVEAPNYLYTLHRSLFLLNLTLAMSLVGTILIWFVGARRFQRPWAAAGKVAAVTGAIVLLAATGFTFVQFDSNQDLKAKVFLRTTQSRQYFGLTKWVLDFDRDGYSSFLGGGDADDSNVEINPGRPEITDDGVDNNCIGGDLTPEAITDWWDERLSLRPLPEVTARKYNIIYIFIDTLRADHLGIYGYPRDTSPNIDKLAARATVFDNAYSPAPNTFEALPRFMQSSYWDGHYPTWTEVLRQNGYNNLLFPRRVSTQKRHIKGMKVVQGGKSERLPKTIDLALDILQKVPPEEPYCAYLYSTDPHSPYLEHDEFKFGPSLVDGYDGEIAFADSQFGRLFDWLESTGRLSNTMIVIMADHGESLGERGVYKHSSQLYNEQIRIPMIVYVPGIPARRVQTHVSSIDLGPTILNAVGIQPPAEYAGVSLLALMRGETVNHPPVFGEQASSEDSPFVRPEQNVHPDSRQYMVITQDGYKMIFNRNHYVFQIYDLKTDPGELNNLYDREPQRARVMKSLLGRYIDITLVSRPWDADESKNFFGRPPDEDSEM